MCWRTRACVGEPWGCVGHSNVLIATFLIPAQGNLEVSQNLAFHGHPTSHLKRHFLRKKICLRKCHFLRKRFQHTSRVLQHTPGFSNIHFWRTPFTGSLQPLLRTRIHCVHYWGNKNHSFIPLNHYFSPPNFENPGGTCTDVS